MGLQLVGQRQCLGTAIDNAADGVDRTQGVDGAAVVAERIDGKTQHFARRVPQVGAAQQWQFHDGAGGDIPDAEGLAKIGLVTLDAQLARHVDQPDDARRGVDDEPPQCVDRALGIALQQVVDEHLGLTEVRHEVVDAGLEHLRQLEVTTGNGGQRVVIHGSVEGEDAAVDRFCGIMNGIGRAFTRPRRCCRCAGATAGECRQYYHDGGSNKQRSGLGDRHTG
ncbi:hypothetical protein D3C76_1190500 [compost metagenome]